MKKLLVSLLSLQLVLLPVAIANESVPKEKVSPAEAIEMGEKAIAQVEEEGFQVLDATGKPLDLLDLGAEPRFRIVSPESDDESFRLDVKVKVDEKQNAQITFVAVGEEEEVLARRLIRIAYTQTPAEVRTKAEQTIRSLSQQMKAGLDRKKSASLLERTNSIFSALFGISSARADEKNDLILKNLERDESIRRMCGMAFFLSIFALLGVPTAVMFLEVETPKWLNRTFFLGIFGIFIASFRLRSRSEGESH